MSNSALATFISRTSGNYTFRTSDYNITKIMIHNAMAAGDRYAMSELINSGTSGYHYGISTDGVVGLFTDETRAAYGCKNTSINDICIHILVMPSADASGAVATTSVSGLRKGSAVTSSSSTVSTPTQQSTTGATKGEGETLYAISENTSDTSLKKTNNKLTNEIKLLLVKLIEDICRRNFILECTYNERNHEDSTLLCHDWYDTSTDCPGKLEEYFSSIASNVNTRLHTARTATELESLKARSTLAVGATSPFLITPDPSVVDINYAQLRDIGVIGALLWGGGLFDANRRKRKSYANPAINIQVENAKKYNMPWAFYADVRSKTADEARAECAELYYVISKHSPKLGLWLHLDFSGISAFSARQIVSIYYDKIVAWGLKGRCGFYTTKSQADLINWPEWTDRFAFWWIAPLDTTEELDSILTPTLFQLR